MEYKVKAVFFIKGEAFTRARDADPFIVDNMPHYELEDGTILFAHVGLREVDPAYEGLRVPEVWYAPIAVDDESKPNIVVPDKPKFIT